VLPAGDFYIGWRQQAPFILNVGYDNNYRFARKGGANPYLFFDLYGKWERVPTDVEGAPMMRPLLGSKSQYAFSMPEPSTVKAGIYPNPLQGNELRINSEARFERFMVSDIQGRCIAAGMVREATLLLPENLKAGVYVLQLLPLSGGPVNLRFQKQ